VELLGDVQYLPLFVLALGGALFVGNVLALVRPPDDAKEGDLERAPRGRSLVMAAVGLVAAIWALATLVA
jgi:hypothetical protein